MNVKHLLTLSRHEQMLKNIIDYVDYRKALGMAESSLNQYSMTIDIVIELRL